MAIGYKELSPKMRTLRILTIAVMLIYSIVTLVLAIQSYNSLEENVTIVQDTIANWKTGAISDIAVSLTGSCTSDYELAYDYKWAGTKVGCDCTVATDLDFQKLGMKAGACNSTETSKGCDAIAAYGNRPLSNWGDIGGTQTTFCVKRSTDTWANIGPTQGTTCPSDKKKCGTTDDNIFCSSDTVCPVTSVSISATACVGCIEMDSGRYLKITRGEDMLPLAEFRLNEFGMCYEANQRARTYNRDYYFLYAASTYDCNGEGNNLWKKLDSETEDVLFSRNSDMSTVISYLDGYGYYETGMDGTDYTWNIYDRGYVPWNMNCRDMMTDIINKSTDLSDIQSAHLGMLVVTIISTIVVGVILTIMEVCNLAGTDLPCIKGKEEEERQKLLRIKAYIQMGVKLFLLPFQIWAIAVLIKVKDLILDVSERNCSSSEMNTLISNASDSLQKAYKSDVGAIVALVVLFVISFIQACCLSKMYKNEVKLRVNNTSMNENYNNNNDTSVNTSQFPLQTHQNQGDQPYNPQHQQMFQQPYQQTPGQILPQGGYQVNPQQQISQMQPGMYPGGFSGQPQGQQITIKLEGVPGSGSQPIDLRINQ